LLRGGRHTRDAISRYSGWDTSVAQVAEVAVSESGDVREHRIVCAVDAHSELCRGAGVKRRALTL